MLAFYAGAVIVPILLASAIGLQGKDLVYLISADLFTCGIASLIQSLGFWKVGVRLPLLQGVTFTAVAPMISIGKANGGGVDGLLAIYGAVIVAGAVDLPRRALLQPPAAPLSAGRHRHGDHGHRRHAAPSPPSRPAAATPRRTTSAPSGTSSSRARRCCSSSFCSDIRGKFIATVAVLLGLVFGTAVATILGIIDFGGVSDAKAWA